MSSKLSNIISYILYTLLGVSVVLVLIFYLGNTVPGTEGSSMEEPVVAEYFLKWAYLLVIATAVLTLGFSVYNMILNPKGLKQVLIVVAVAVVLAAVSYYLASDQILPMEGYEGTQNEPKTLKFAGTGLWATYLLAGGALLSILYSEIAKYFK